MNLAEAERILGVKVGASAEDVRAAFAVVVKRHHPDLVGTARLEAGGELASAKRARDLLLERSGHKEPSAKVCPVCRGSGIQVIGLRRVPCVRGCRPET